MVRLGDGRDGPDHLENIFTTLKKHRHLRFESVSFLFSIFSVKNNWLTGTKSEIKINALLRHDAPTKENQLPPLALGLKIVFMSTSAFFKKWDQAHPV